MADKTNNWIGVTETLVSTCVCGVLFSLLAGESHFHGDRKVLFLNDDIAVVRMVNRRTRIEQSDMFTAVTITLNLHFDNVLDSGC